MVIVILLWKALLMPKAIVSEIFMFVPILYISIALSEAEKRT